MPARGLGQRPKHGTATRAVPARPVTVAGRAGPCLLQTATPMHAWQSAAVAATVSSGGGGGELPLRQGRH
uniref:Uncharacterized protein n=1 Tax=Oryza sativa subsp. japonica TaxID=39947 RepID=Q5Z844_ORYSJ|nr:hypothetical protein [Oryza sativa Japonica Group]